MVKDCNMGELHFSKQTSISHILTGTDDILLTRHLLTQTLMGSCGSEDDTSEMLLAGPGQIPEE